MADSSNRIGSGKKQSALQKISSSFNLGLCQTGREIKTLAEYVSYTKEVRDTQCLFVLCLYPSFVLHTSQLLPFPFNLAVLPWEAEARFKKPWDFLTMEVVSHGALLADVFKLVCLVLDGKISENLRLLQYLPIQLPHPEILLPLKMLGVF